MILEILLIIIIFVILGVLAYFSYKNIVETYYTINDDLTSIVSDIYTAFPIINNLNFYEGNKSFTINKKDVYICMRDKNGKYYDRNFLIFVILHEISHAMCDEIGHTSKFIEIFEKNLDKAAKMGIYDPMKKKIENYCNY